MAPLPQKEKPLHRKWSVPVQGLRGPYWVNCHSLLPSRTTAPLIPQPAPKVKTTRRRVGARHSRRGMTPQPQGCPAFKTRPRSVFPGNASPTHVHTAPKVGEAFRWAPCPTTVSSTGRISCQGTTVARMPRPYNAPPLARHQDGGDDPARMTTGRGGDAANPQTRRPGWARHRQILGSSAALLAAGGIGGVDKSHCRRCRRPYRSSQRRRGTDGLDTRPRRQAPSPMRVVGATHASPLRMAFEDGAVRTRGGEQSLLLHSVYFRARPHRLSTGAADRQLTNRWRGAILVLYIWFHHSRTPQIAIFSFNVLAGPLRYRRSINPPLNRDGAR